jgi:hypothetical protein
LNAAKKEKRNMKRIPMKKYDSTYKVGVLKFQAKTGLTQSQTQAPLSIEVKQKLKKL